MQLLYKILQITLQHYLQDLLDVLKFQLQMKKPTIVMSMILTIYYTMFPIHTILKTQKLFDKLLTRYNKKMTVPFHQISLHQVYMKNSDKPRKTSSLYCTTYFTYLKSSNFSIITLHHRKSQIYQQFQFLVL